MKKVSDIIAQTLVDEGINTVFMLTGGGAMHLNYSLGTHSGLKCYYNHHEQGCAIAAEGFVRGGGKIAAVNVTTGPGGLNTLTGLMGQWTDSVPVIYISGQVKQTTTMQHYPDLHLRQLGDQEVDIINIVKPLTKFALSVTNPCEVRYNIRKAIHIALSGRPGPVWIDVPMDIQSAMVNENDILEYNTYPTINNNNNEAYDQIISLLKEAKRPLIIAGHGIRISNSINLLVELLEKTKIPVVTTLNGMDLLSTSNPYYIGRIGSQGDRAGNFALQNADLVLSIGSRNNIRQTTYNWECFANKAKLVIIDIDEEELKKPNIHPFLCVCCDASVFLKTLTGKVENLELPDWEEWRRWGKERQLKYPVVQSGYSLEKEINPYYFIDVLTKILPEESTIITANGSASVCTFQAGVIKRGTRIIMNSGCAAMGYELPASIGASIAANKGNVICIAGDGSFQMNLQEMQTAIYYQLPIKIFYFDNAGYSSIKQTQSNFFNNSYVGCDYTSGISFPDMIKIASSYGIQTVDIVDTSVIESGIKQTLNMPGMVFCRVKLSVDYKFMPKVSSQKLPDGQIVSKPLEDMYPFLSENEQLENIISI